jgi:galactokinase
MTPRQHASAQRAAAALSSTFGRDAAGFVQAPGRVNLIGEHTDYNDGFVLPCAIDRSTVVAWAPRDDGRIRVVACDAVGAVDCFAAGAAAIPRNDALPWSNYVRGISLELRGALAGASFGGADLAIAGDVPAGAGLSSSAALEVAVGHALLAAAGATMTATALALAAQRAENGFVGCRCGVMDMLVSAHGGAGAALLIDCRSLVLQPVPLPPGTAVLIAHSRVRRGLVDSAYNERREACERAARQLDVPALRDATPAQLHAAAQSGSIDAETLRRARHVVTENARTQQAAAALAAGDLAAVGRSMAASHASMRDDFEITVPAVDRLVALLQHAIGAAGGARMTGGGFGGCAVALLPLARLAEVRAAVLAGYRSPDGERALLFDCSASAGAGPITLSQGCLNLPRPVD